MPVNLGTWDRRIRIIAGSVIMILALIYQSWWALLGLALVINGLTGRCGGYALFGLSTAKPCKVTESHKD